MAGAWGLIETCPARRRKGNRDLKMAELCLADFDTVHKCHSGANRRTAVKPPLIVNSKLSLCLSFSKRGKTNPEVHELLHNTGGALPAHPYVQVFFKRKWCWIARGRFQATSQTFWHSRFNTTLEGKPNTNSEQESSPNLQTPKTGPRPGPCYLPPFQRPSGGDFLF